MQDHNKSFRIPYLNNPRAYRRKHDAALESRRKETILLLAKLIKPTEDYNPDAVMMSVLRDLNLSVELFTEIGESLEDKIDDQNVVYVTDG